MPTALTPEVLADPMGVIVNLVVGQEPTLDRAVITDAVEDGSATVDEFLSPFVFVG